MGEVDDPYEDLPIGNFNFPKELFHELPESVYEECVDVEVLRLLNSVSPFDNDDPSTMPDVKLRKSLLNGIAWVREKLAATAASGRTLMTYTQMQVDGRGFARQYAADSSMKPLQTCPRLLRGAISGDFFGDYDIGTAWPTFGVGVAQRMGFAVPTFACYVESPESQAAVRKTLADHYGVTPQKAKYAVLRVLNRGGIEKWIKDSECIRGQNECQLDLRELQEEAGDVMDSFFKMDQFKDHVAVMTEEMKISTAAKVRAANELYKAAAAHAKVDAKRALDEAKRKATRIAIRRSVFAGCCFELEDSVLAVVDCHLKEKGWTVATLIYDGLLVEVRPDADLEAVLREAETAVKQKLDYKIALMEKPLFTKPMGVRAQEDQPPLEEPPGEQAQEDQAMSEEPQA